MNKNVVNFFENLNDFFMSFEKSSRSGSISSFDILVLFPKLLKLFDKSLLSSVITWFGKMDRETLIVVVSLVVDTLFLLKISVRNLWEAADK